MRIWIETSYKGEVRRVPMEDQPIRIGRAPDCDLAFPDDREVSRAHATIERRSNAWYLVDHKSTNGSYVNGQRVTVPFPLKDNDVLAIGDQLLRICSGIEIPTEQRPGAGAPAPES